MSSDILLRQNTGRLGSRKSSTGCVTCKIRRVKCDEQQPHCRRCISTGRRCDGYPLLQHASSETQPASPALHNDLQYLAIWGDKPPQQVRYFDFFLDRILPGFPRIIDDSFWHEAIPQLSRTEPPLWDAVVALSCLVRHPQFSTAIILPRHDKAPVTDENHRTALRWYTNSLAGLRGQISRQQSLKPWMLATCLLYICIECLQENPAEALFLYQRLVSVLGLAFVRDPTGSSNINLENSIRAFLRHESIAHGLPIPRPKQVLDSAVGTFESLHDAREELYASLGHVQTFIQAIAAIKDAHSMDWSPSTEMLDQQVLLRDNLLQWHAALTQTLDNLPSIHLTPDQRELRSVLLIAYGQYFIWLSSCLTMSELRFDDYLDEFKAIVREAETLVDTTHPDLQPIFLFETRVIPSLYFVAIKCREPHVRRHALRLLRNGPKIENTWKASSMADVAERLIGIEESGVPNGHFESEPRHPFLPPLHSRIYRQEVVEQLDGHGRRSHFLVVYRWQQDSNLQWFRDQQPIHM